MEKTKIGSNNLEASHPGCTHEGCANGTKASKSTGIEVTHPGCTHPGCEPVINSKTDSYGRPELKQANSSGLVAVRRC